MGRSDRRKPPEDAPVRRDAFSRRDQLARVNLLAGDSLAALSDLRRGLAFDTTDVAARDFAAILERRFAPPERRTK